LLQHSHAVAAVFAAPSVIDMNTPSLARRFGGATLLAVAVAAALLGGCQKRSTTVQTPEGTVTTTTVEPTPAVRDELGQAASAASTALSRAGVAASQALGKAKEASADAAERVRESASSGTLARVGDAASGAAGRIGEAASGAVDRVRESARSGALARVGDAAGDAAITAKVKGALLADQYVKGMQIDVDTHDGAVTLTGAADTQPNLDRAADIARKIDGVKSVENRITVKKPG
jgi:hyperosmotically inducible protein